MAKDQVFCKGCGARVDYPHVAVVISDGRSSASDDQLRKASKELKVLNLRDHFTLKFNYESFLEV